MASEKRFTEITKGKRVLFITTHRIDYIRNTQEIELLKEGGASVRCLYSNADNHIISAVKIFFTLLFSSLSDVDVVMVSYMCQLVIPLMNWKLKKKTLIVDFFVSLYDSMVNDRKLVKPGSLPARLIRPAGCQLSETCRQDYCRYQGPRSVFLSGVRGFLPTGWRYSI